MWIKYKMDPINLCREFEGQLNIVMPSWGKKISKLNEIPGVELSVPEVISTMEILYNRIIDKGKPDKYKKCDIVFNYLDDNDITLYEDRMLGEKITKRIHISKPGYKEYTLTGGMFHHRPKIITIPTDENILKVFQIYYPSLRYKDTYPDSWRIEIEVEDFYKSENKYAFPFIIAALYKLGYAPMIMLAKEYVEPKGNVFLMGGKYCEGKTKKGSKCRNKVAACDRHCRYHRYF